MVWTVKKSVGCRGGVGASGPTAASTRPRRRRSSRPPARICHLLHRASARGVELLPTMVPLDRVAMSQAPPRARPVVRRRGDGARRAQTLWALQNARALVQHAHSSRRAGTELSNSAILLCTMLLRLQEREKIPAIPISQHRSYTA